VVSKYAIASEQCHCCLCDCSTYEYPFQPKAAGKFSRESEEEEEGDGRAQIFLDTENRGHGWRSGFRCDGRVHKFLNIELKSSVSGRCLVVLCATVF
jgi:hypothetical protein